MKLPETSNDNTVITSPGLNWSPRSTAALEEGPSDRSWSHGETRNMAPGGRQSGREKHLDLCLLLSFWGHPVTKPNWKPEARESSDVVNRGQPLRTLIRREGEGWARE